MSLQGHLYHIIHMGHSFFLLITRQALQSPPLLRRPPPPPPSTISPSHVPFLFYHKYQHTEKLYFHCSST